MSKFTIGVDVGGTNIKLGVVNPFGKIMARSVVNTKEFYHSRTKLFGAIVGAIKDLMKNNHWTPQDMLGAGFGLPGLIDSTRGVVNILPNIPGWRRVPFKIPMEKELRIPVFIDNDVNVIALGEWKFGAGKGFNNLMCLTLGTGVGGGLILNGELYRGEGFAAGELGHMPLNEKGPACNCGGWGCFERAVGNGVLQEKAGKIFKNKNITLPDVFRLAAAGNDLAVEFWEEAAGHIGNALVGVVNLLNLRLIIIGGGVSNNYKFMGKKINEVVKRRAMKVQGEMVKITRAKLGDDAGILGAHILVKELIRGR